MGERKVACGLVLLLLAAVLAAVLARSQKQKVEYVLNYAENQAADYPTTLGAYRFAELVEERTDGRIQILVHADAELGTEKETLRQMQYGGIDFARVSLSELAEILPEMNVLQLPYLYRDREHMWRVLDGAIGDRFLAATADARLVGLAWYDAGVRGFYSKEKPIASLEDLRGMRVRVQESKLMAQMVTALGAVPVQMPYGEVYSALELGKVDAAENNWSSYASMKHYEVAPYYTEDAHTRIPEIQLASAHTWEKLTEQDQEVLRACAQESADYERDLWTAWEKEAKEKAVANGAKAVGISEEEKDRFRQAVETVYETYAAGQEELLAQIRQLGES